MPPSHGPEFGTCTHVAPGEGGTKLDVGAAEGEGAADAVADNVPEAEVVDDGDCSAESVDDLVPDGVAVLDRVPVGVVVNEGVEEGRVLGVASTDAAALALGEAVGEREKLALGVIEVLADGAAEGVASAVACARLGAPSPPHPHAPSSVTACAPLGAARIASPGLTVTRSRYAALAPPRTVQPQQDAAPAQLPQPAQQLSAPLDEDASCSSMYP